MTIRVFPNTVPLNHVLVNFRVWSIGIVGWGFACVRYLNKIPALIRRFIGHSVLLNHDTLNYDILRRIPCRDINCEVWILSGGFSVENRELHPSLLPRSDRNFVEVSLPEGALVGHLQGGLGVACQELQCVFFHSSMVEPGLAPRPATCYPRFSQQYGSAGL